MRLGAPELASVVPARSPGFCVGCPERPIFSALTLVQQDLGMHHISGDIGCHLFAAMPPFHLGATTMGYDKQRRVKPQIAAAVQRGARVVKDLMAGDPALALELLQCRRLVKGYSDTHARGMSKFDWLMRAALLLHGRPDAAAQLAGLRAAALADPEGTQLRRRWDGLGLGEFSGAPDPRGRSPRVGTRDR